MKILYLFLVLSFNAHANQNSNCSVTGAGLGQGLEDCLNGSIAVLAQMKSEEIDSPEATKKAAELFLDRFKESVEFDEPSAKALAVRLKKHGENPALSNKDRSKLWLLASGIHGRLADKLRVNGGLEQGKFALGAIKKSISLDKSYKSAAQAYATTIIAFSEQSFIARKFIESNMEIKISTEAKSAMKAMEDAKLTLDPLYAKLKAI